jgi:sugar lactone lactonase YvrE
VEFVNSMAVLNEQTGLIILADTWNGVVWSLNVKTGVLDLAINDTTMAAPFTANAINGIKIYNNDLFYTNTQKNTLSKIGIDRDTGHATGPAILLATKTDLAPDDFTLDSKGNAFVASHSGKVVFIAGVSTAKASTSPIAVQDVAQFNSQAPTSVQFGKRPVDLIRKSFYVTSNGFTNGAIDLPKGSGVWRVDCC